MRNILELPGKPETWLQNALQDFEAEFSYPLGANRSFRISHPEDYGRFSRSIGEARSFIAEENGVIDGAISISIRDLISPDGDCIKAAYICDMKLRKEARTGRLLLALSRMAMDWCQARAQVAYGVVMEGTATTPLTYTGRLGIPPFREAAKLAVLRLENLDQNPPAIPRKPAENRKHSNAKDIDQQGTESNFRDLFSELSSGYFATPLAHANERSAMEPTWLALGREACGCLEDTRRAKRLVEASGEEMLSAHLTGLAYSDIASGARLVRRAAAIAGSRGYPALFLSVPLSAAPELCRALEEFTINIAPAAIYACGITAGGEWLVNTSEI